MSVKDKIAMWNNIGANNNTLPPPKMVTTAPVSKPKEPVQPTISQSQSTHQKNEQVENTVLLKPSEMKKKTAAQLIQIITKSNPEQASKTFTTTIKPAQPIKKQISTNSTNQNTWIKTEPPIKKQNPAPVVTSSNKFQVETSSIAKPSDIKKKFEQDISGNNFHFIAPQPIKRVESVTITQNPPPTNVVNAQYQIQRDVPKVNVKQNAQRLTQFFNKKKEEQNMPKPNNQAQQRQYQQTKIQEPSKSQQKQSQNHQPAAILVHSQPLIVQTEQKAAAVEVKQPEVKPDDTYDIAARLKNRNKKKRAYFDSQDD